MESADEGADLICNWILKEPLYGPDRVRVIKDVLNEFARRKSDGSLPALPNLAALPITELIQRFQPNTPLDNSLASLTEYAKWLFRWAFFAIKDPVVRDDALKQALKRLSGK